MPPPPSKKSEPPVCSRDYKSRTGAVSEDSSVNNFPKYITAQGRSASPGGLCPVASHYDARLNVNILGFFSQTRTSRWTFDVSSALYAVGTKAAIKTIAENKKVFRHDKKWHLGYGGHLGDYELE